MGTAAWKTCDPLATLPFCPLPFGAMEVTDGEAPPGTAAAGIDGLDERWFIARLYSNTSFVVGCTVPPTTNFHSLGTETITDWPKVRATTSTRKDQSATIRQDHIAGMANTECPCAVPPTDSAANAYTSQNSPAVSGAFHACCHQA